MKRSVDRLGPEAVVEGVVSGAPRTHDDHALLETATLAGGATGVIAGAIAGPPGAVIGGVLGLAVGMLAGDALEHAEDAARSHERELDEAIGVLKGSLGSDAHDRTLDSASAETNAIGLGSALAEGHRRLESLCDALLRAYREGDWSDVQATWPVFERVLIAHLDTEEACVFPLYWRSAPCEAAKLVEEHKELRNLVEDMALGIELHTVSEGQAAGLIARLRAHGRREDSLLYPWIDAARDAATLVDQPA